jgi:hypothetical protein
VLVGQARRGVSSPRRSTSNIKQAASTASVAVTTVGTGAWCFLRAAARHAGRSNGLGTYATSSRASVTGFDTVGTTLLLQQQNGRGGKVSTAVVVLLLVVAVHETIVVVHRADDGRSVPFIFLMEWTSRQRERLAQVANLVGAAVVFVRKTVPLCACSIGTTMGQRAAKDFLFLFVGRLVGTNFSIRL